jgi:hypothetical protein
VARAYTAAHGYTGKVTCSNGIGALHARSPDFICEVPARGVTCDQFEVHRYGRHWHVALRRRGVDCVLPA